MKNIAFTICSNNYLSQAKVLSDSVYKYSKETYDFIIVLCDVFSDKIDYSDFHAAFIEAKNLGISNFKWMTKYYNIVELNTAIKPFAFKYLYKKYKPEYIHYLDPDTCIYQSLERIEDEMKPDYSILLTPHSFSPTPFDGGFPTDNLFLNTGIYNLGFLGTRQTGDTDDMLDWWCDFLSEHCLDKKYEGFFVDQLPMELTPLFFKNVKISQNKGINVAYWNLHERLISFDEIDKKFYVNKDTPLIMYHFSSFVLDDNKKIAKCSIRTSFEGNAGLKRLFELYASQMRDTKYDIYKGIPCIYTKRQEVYWRSFLRRSSNRIAKIARCFADYLARI